MPPDDTRARLNAAVNRLSPYHRQACDFVVQEALKIVEEERAKSAARTTELETRIADLQDRLLRVKNLSSVPNQ